MTATCDSESIATRIVEPGGIVTRTAGPGSPPQAAAKTVARTAMTRRQLLSSTSAPLQRVLQENRRGQRIDVAFASLGRATHLANGAQCGRCGVSLVDELHGQAGALRKRVADG